MEPRFIDIFGEAVRSVFEMIGSAPVSWERREPASSHPAWGDIGGLISLQGQHTTGSLLLCFDAAAARSLASAMLCEEIAELNDDARSVIGEVTNMVCGDAKRRLDELGFSVGMALPRLWAAGDPVPPAAAGDVIVLSGLIPGGTFKLSVDFKLS